MNNTVLIFIALPIALGLVLIFLERWQRLSAFLAAIIPLSLTGFALIFSQRLNLNFLGQYFVLEDSLSVFGRIIQIEANQLGMVALLYFVCFLWNLPVKFLVHNHWFNSLSLIISGLWVLVLFINPFLYSALVVELIVLISVPLLSPRGAPAKAGIMRYLTMQTLALPMVLLSGWMVAGIETSPSAQALVSRGAFLVLTGFMLWAGVFPLHSWQPMLSEESQTWSFSFLLVIMQVSLTFFFLHFLNQYPWLRNLEQLGLVLKWLGSLSIVAAGGLAAFQTNLKRISSYIFMAEAGYTILTFAYLPQGGLEIITMSLLPRLFGLWTLNFAISYLSKNIASEKMELEDLKCIIYRFPATSGLLIISMLNIIGMPLFSLFPSKRILWGIVIADNLLFQILGIIGFLGFMIAILRTLNIMIKKPENGEEEKVERPIMILPIALIVLIVVLAGTFPQLFSAPIQNILLSFNNLFP